MLQNKAQSVVAIYMYSSVAFVNFLSCNSYNIAVLYLVLDAAQSMLDPKNKPKTKDEMVNKIFSLHYTQSQYFHSI